MKKDFRTEQNEIEEKQIGKIPGLVVLLTYDVFNLMVNAIEGGSNYWYLLGEQTEKAKELTPEMKGEPLVTRMMKAIIQHDLIVEIFYAEDEEEKLGELSKESFAKAEKLLIEKYRSHLGDILSECDDSSTGDVFFQLAVMGEIVYG